MDDEYQIDKLARQLRQWIEQQERHSLPAAFANFPARACEWASCLLALWLARNGELGFTPDYGFDDDREHVWLTRDGLIVDITGDQFRWPPVIVTRSSRWHPSSNTAAFPAPDWPPPMVEECRRLLERAVL